MTEEREHFTREQLIGLIEDVCPHCKAKNISWKRDDTDEWCHDFVKGTSMSHTMCLASHLRNKYKDVIDG